jgi:hypothetical protein
MPSIALTKNPIDLSSVNAKELALDFGFHYPTTGTGTIFIYLTTNKTLPSGNALYSPDNDRNVAFVIKMQNSTNGGGAFNTLVFIQRNPAESVASEYIGCGSATASDSSCLGIDSNTIQPGQTSLGVLLNFTGTSCNANGSSCSGGQSGVSDWHGVSFVYTTISTSLPQLSVTPSYYLGFFESVSASNVFDLAGTVNSANCFIGSLQLGAVNCMSIANAVPLAPNCSNNNGVVCIQTQPTIDTGGFFGPIIRALISIGVFIAANLIGFFQYLYSLTIPVFSLAAGIIGSALVTILNAFGNIFGDSSLGTQISSAFTQIVAYLTNVFVIAINLWGNVVTMIKNMINFFSTYFTSFQSFVESFLLTIVNLWTPILALWNEVMKWFNAGSMTIQQIIMLDYVVGMFKVYTSGTDGFKDWLDINELFTLKIFRGAYWALDEAYGFVVQLKQLLFGNRISPVTIAGEG